MLFREKLNSETAENIFLYLYCPAKCKSGWPIYIEGFLIFELVCTVA